MQGKLTVIEGKSQGISNEFRQDSKITIGRNRRCTMMLDDNKVSGMHCQIEISTSQCAMKDLGSTNGSYVNGEKVEFIHLQNGDEISVGNSKIRIEYECTKAEKPHSGGVMEITEAWSEGELPMPMEDEKRVGNYRVLREIDSFGDGKFLQAEHIGHKNIVTLRYLPAIENSDMRRSFAQTMSICKNFDNPRLLKVFDIIEDGEFPVVVMEYIQGCALGMRVRKKKHSLSRSLKISAYAAGGIGYLHKMGVYKVGLTPENIIVEDVTKHIKIFDIALSRWLKENGCPPLLKDNQYYLYDNAEDVHALGVLLFFLLTNGKNPKKLAQSGSSLAQKLAGNGKVPMEIINLLERTLHPQSPQDLPTAKEFYKIVTVVLQELKH